LGARIWQIGVHIIKVQTLLHRVLFPLDAWYLSMLVALYSFDGLLGSLFAKLLYGGWNLLLGELIWNMG